MSEPTQNYQLVTSVAVDDFVQPGHNNRLADTVDRVVGSVLRRLATEGVHEGWQIQSDRTVSTGEGLIAACWCETTQAQAITGLTDDAVNHVFVQPTADGAPQGEVDVFAQLASTGPTDSCYLGTIELDAGGAVVEIDNEAPDVQRQCYQLAWRSLSGEGIEEDVPAGGEVSFEITHDRLRIPGAIELQSGSADFEWAISATHRPDAFVVTVTNNGGSEADFEYTWTREGVGE